MRPSLQSCATTTTPKFGWEVDEAAVGRAAELCAQALDIMDAHLTKNHYLAGDQFSLADAFLMPNMALLMRTPEAVLITKRPHIASWWQRVSARHAWRQTDALNELEHHGQEQKV